MSHERPKPPRSSARHHSLTWLLAVVIVAVGAYAGYTSWRIFRTPLPAAGLTFTVTRGETVDSLARKLYTLGVLHNAWDLILLARLQGRTRHIQAGEYRIPAGLSVAGLLSMLVRGQVLLYDFVIVPGTTFAEIIFRLDHNSVFRPTLKGLSGRAIMAKLGHPGQYPEGLFAPDTYAFARGIPNIAVLRQAYTEMQRRLNREWQGRAKNLPLKTPYQALILASIIEKETAIPEERKKVAGVFIRRLEHGMHLDADPTVIYGLGRLYHGAITRADLRRDTAYNTYLHYGLPPTPICMPSLASIHAALHPGRGKSLYFVAKGDGTHVFSDTLAEQKAMIKKYLLDKGKKLRNGHPKRH